MRALIFKVLTDCTLTFEKDRRGFRVQARGLLGIVCAGGLLLMFLLKFIAP